MLDWLKRKPAAAPDERLLADDGRKPATDERLERMLGRLGGDNRAHGEPAAEVLDKPPPNRGDSAPSTAAAETPSEIGPPVASDSRTAEAPAVTLGDVDSPSNADSRKDDGFTLRRADLTITQRGTGPSAAELLAKGYSFATGPDGRMVVFDAEGRLTDAAPPQPSADGGATGAAAAAALTDIAPSAGSASTAGSLADMLSLNPPPGADSSEPAAQALSEVAAPPSAPAVEVPSEAAPPASRDDMTAEAPAAEALNEITPLPKPRQRTVREPAAEDVDEIAPPPRAGRRTAGSPVQMRVIAVASQKGGSGKTTIAAHLAVRADAAGQGPVVLIDTDPQGSLAEWWRARAEDTPHLASVRPEALAANLAELRSYGTALAVIDTPPALTGSIEQVIAMADLILIPVRPSPHDLRAAGGTVELARQSGKPFMFVINSASPRASITAQAVAALSEHGRVAPVILYQRTEFAASMIDGRTVMETAGSGRSAQEIAELWECVHAQIGLRVAA